MPIGRDHLRRFFERHWIGPQYEDEVIYERPSYKYTAGILFARGLNAARFQRDDHGEAPGGARGRRGQDRDSAYDEVIRSSQDTLPSSAAVSFYTTATLLSCTVEVGVYDNGSKDRTYQRTQLRDVEVQISENDPTVAVLDGRAAISSRWRTKTESGGRVVTVALSNTVEHSEDRTAEWRDSLFQVGMSVEPVDGSIGEYPSPGQLALTEEEEELALLYRDRPSVAIGHGCAASWERGPEAGAIRSVSITFMPHFEVPGLVPRKSDQETLQLGWLATAEPEELFRGLRAFIGEYETWSVEQQKEAASIEKRHSDAAGRVFRRMTEVIRRMGEGIDRLESEPAVLRAFRLANEAMLIQMVQGRDERAGLLHRRGQAVHDPIWEGDGALRALTEERWYPFQLAFQLMALCSTIDADHDDRDLVDLIWFPTGGGKTEAYLAVAATAVLYQRLTSDASHGTDVITRYTLRLLTSQQFQRTSRLVCALEVLRQREEPELGDTPITAGLWVGDDTPRSFSGSKERCEEILGKGRPKNTLMVLRCPWCGTRIVPSRQYRTATGETDRSYYGFEFDNDSFSFHCPDPDCRFSEGIPVQVVDEALYQNPPTFLVGTVDKFARLAWLGGGQEDPGVFLGASGHRTPSLVIQDELHLLSGPLGTTVGIYEAAISTVCELRGAAPKVVASTATIRDAGGQVRAIYGRNTAIFPPPGLLAKNSWFAHTSEEEPGRSYIGLLSPHHTPSTSMVRSCAIVLQGVHELHKAVTDTLDEITTTERASLDLRETEIADGDGGGREVDSESLEERRELLGHLSHEDPLIRISALSRYDFTSTEAQARFDELVDRLGDQVMCLSAKEYDAYWTLIAYHNSLRELGKTVTFARDDIPARMEVIARDSQKGLRSIHDDQIIELTSNVKAEDIPNFLSRLETGADQRNGVAFAACTNMFSTGVDVQRLGLMVVNGQPKTTSDYIQATSRVGRGAVPGLVLTQYSATKPRDRSHYENFRSYHEALYRYVEPTSVTPFSLPSRNRALPAALVIVVRHGLGYGGNADAGTVDFTSTRLAAALDRFLNRVEMADPDEAADTRTEINRLIDSWEQEILNPGNPLYYYSGRPDRSVLRHPHGRHGMWESQHSMRMADRESPVDIRETLA